MRSMKGRVLVVDDDAALSEMLGIMLRGEGFEPTFVPDGDHAMQAFRETHPDLVLLDLMLPGVDGIDPDLWSQFELAEEVCAALGIVVWPMVEFEADDALSTAAQRGVRVTQATLSRDLRLTIARRAGKFREWPEAHFLSLARAAGNRCLQRRLQKSKRSFADRSPRRDFCCGG